jgi:hypothetical protein
MAGKALHPAAGGVTRAGFQTEQMYVIRNEVEEHAVRFVSNRRLRTAGSSTREMIVTTDHLAWSE